MPRAPANAPAQGGGQGATTANDLVSELATMAESGVSNQELFQYASSKGLDKQQAIAICKKAKRQAAENQRIANELPPGMGGGQPMGPAPVSDRPVYSSRTEYNQPEKGGSVGGAWLAVLAGIGMIVAGIGITAVSYNSASDGGSYRVFYGLIIVGGITLIKGIASLVNG